MIVHRAALIRRGPGLPAVAIADWSPLSPAEVRAIDWQGHTQYIERTGSLGRAEHGYRHRLVLDRGPEGIEDYLGDVELEFGDPFDWRI